MAQKKPSVADRLVAAALDLAAERGWNSVSLADIARRANVSLVQAYDTFPDKAAVAAGILAAIDREVLAEGPVAEDESARDRLFDILMRQFDALQARRAGVAALLRQLPADPLTVLMILPNLARSLAWMLEAAGVSSTGLKGNLRVKALGVIFLVSLRTWLTDDTADLSRTMAVLDRALKEAEGLARRLPGFAESLTAETMSPSTTPQPPSNPPTPAAAG